MDQFLITGRCGRTCRHRAVAGAGDPSGGQGAVLRRRAGFLDDCKALFPKRVEGGCSDRVSASFRRLSGPTVRSAGRARHPDLSQIACPVVAGDPAHAVAGAGDAGSDDPPDRGRAVFELSARYRTRSQRPQVFPRIAPSAPMRPAPCHPKPCCAVICTCLTMNGSKSWSSRPRDCGWSGWRKRRTGAAILFSAMPKWVVTRCKASRCKR